LKGIFISVRTNSTRLPNKALLDLCGKPTIQYLIDNLKRSLQADKIILCTSTLSEDKALCDIADSSGIDFFQGSLEDKLLRWSGACEKFNIDFFVNVDGDDLFFDHGLADLVFKQYDNTNADFIDGRGLYNDVYGISKKGLHKALDNKESSDTEFIKLYFDNVKNFITTEKILDVPLKYQKKQVRLTLDYIEDLEFFTAVISRFKKVRADLSFENIMLYLEKNPSVVNINWHREQNWKDNQINMIKRMKNEGL